MQVKVVHATKEKGNRKQETSIANIYPDFPLGNEVINPSTGNPPSK